MSSFNRQLDAVRRPLSVNRQADFGVKKVEQRCKHFRRQHYRIGSGVIAVLLIAGLLIGLPTQANTVYLFPKVCSGDWTNSELAQGEVDISLSKEAITATTAARHANESTTLACNTFEGVLPPDAVILKTELHLFWAASQKLDTSIEVTEIKETDQEVQDSAVESEKEEQKGTFRFIKTVHAEEVSLTNIATSTEQQIEHESEEVLTISQSETATVTESSVATTVPVEPSVQQEQEPDLFTITYSVDGNGWLELRAITESALYKPLPLPVLLNEDFAKIAIKISTGTENNSRELLLDGMAIVVEVEDAKPIQPDWEHGAVGTVQAYGNITVFSFTDELGIEKLWLLDRRGLLPQWAIIGDADIYKSSSLLVIKNGAIFWLSPDGQAIVGYDVNTGAYSSHTIDKSNQDDKLLFDQGNLYVTYQNGQFIFGKTDTNEFVEPDSSAEEIKAFLDEYVLPQAVEKPLEVPVVEVLESDTLTSTEEAKINTENSTETPEVIEEDETDTDTTPQTVTDSSQDTENNPTETINTPESVIVESVAEVVAEDEVATEDTGNNNQIVDPAQGEEDSAEIEPVEKPNQHVVEPEIKEIEQVIDATEDVSLEISENSEKAEETVTTE